ncbi:arginine:ornithine antiporter, APA family [Granulicatella balaenopterae]|uniref:Arginine:ornithine antiporter, APA family n=1 Tax=Granulicatella balaenopterae TaxID=137733 RepID=A0A1H9M864_9LACT|nr:basic amino acid/polyamine antiporter [Granulicatella balaenopterae]SER19960.1 arginine:ornithine antiporter, APA family [Granulicatella balaenopterae]
MTQKEKKIGMLGLIALTINSVIGGGIFNLMSDIAKPASVGPAIIALIISGTGMGVFVFCLQNLNRMFPYLDAGVYSYAEKGFGSFVSFISAFGYWLSVFLGNVAQGALAFSALAYFFPIFGDGSNIYSVIGASVLLWLMHFTILRGSNFAAKINDIITIAKLLPLAIFIITLIIAFDSNMFSLDFWGTMNGSFNWSEVGPQVSGAMVVVVWVFLGVDGATVYSARAKNKRIVGKANVLAFLIISSIYLLATVLSFSVMTRPELASLDKPAMSYVLESVVGKWGAVLINLGVAVSAIGAWFACTMLSGEILFQAAKDAIFPKYFLKENKFNAPSNALFMSNALIQFFFLSLLVNKSAYNFTALLASNTMLVPYFLVSLSQIKLSWKWDGRRISKNVILGVIASVYMGYCMIASGFEYIFATTLLFGPGVLLYIFARKESDKPVFNKWELIGAIMIVILAIISLVCIINGTIDIANM